MGVGDHPVDRVTARVLEYLVVLADLTRPQRREAGREALGEAHRPNDQAEAEAEVLSDLRPGKLLRGRERQVCLNGTGGGHGGVVPHGAASPGPSAALSL